jgi:hypothetical protein
MAVLWVVAPCSLVEFYQRFRGLAASIIKVMSDHSTSQTAAIFMEQYVSSKRRYLPVSLYGVITQKNNINRCCLLSNGPPLECGELIWWGSVAREREQERPRV